MIIPHIVRQHAEDAATVYGLRRSRTAAPHATLDHLSHLDERLAAHLDGVFVGAEESWPACEAALGAPSAGAMFVATVQAIEERRRDRLHLLLDLAKETRGAREGATSAFGWLPRAKLNGIVVDLLHSHDPMGRLFGVAACAMHRVDPASILDRCVHDKDAVVRARGFRTAGELGLGQFASTCSAAVGDDDPTCRECAAWSAVMLGDRGRALDALVRISLEPGAVKPRALRLALQAASPSASRHMLQVLAREPQQACLLIEGSGAAGDPAYVPWLINQMANKQTAAIAAEAVAVITGVHAASVGTADVESFDPDGIQRWWDDHASEFRLGTRYFMGAPVTREHCIEVLKTGYQRQRILAAHYLCLLDPGTPLFNTSAPAWRQQRQLAALV